MFKKILSWFNKPIETPYAKGVNYNYVRNNNTDISSITPDIISYTKHINYLLRNDIFNDTEYKYIKKVSVSSLHKKSLMLWFSDNGRILENPETAYEEFMESSLKLISEFEKLKQYRNSDVEHKFNIRMLQPYIINLEDIRRCFIQG